MCACVHVCLACVCVLGCVSVRRKKAELGGAGRIVPGSKCVCLMSSWGGERKGAFLLNPCEVILFFKVLTIQNKIT